MPHWVMVCGVSTLALSCAPEEVVEPKPECTSFADCASLEKPFCEPETQKCAPRPVAYQLGWDDGDPSSVDFEMVYNAPGRRVVRGFDFRPDTDELWLTEGQAQYGAVPCNKLNASAETCEPKGGDFVVVYRATTTYDRSDRIRDGNALHFARNPSSLVFSENEFFGTCPESRTANFDDEIEDFAGPTLWSADRSILGVDIGKNGSHMDMLHFTPYCMGLEHEKDNVYWAFNGQKGSIDRYDFKEDHGPGEEDHSDGEILRYIEGTVAREEEVSSQMAMDRDNDYLYIADTGNSRIIRLDIRSGTRGGVMLPNYDFVRVHHQMNGSEYEEIELGGEPMGKPSGLLLHEGLLYVIDHTYSEFRVFTTEGVPVRTLYTDFRPESLGSLVLGPDDRIYFNVPHRGEIYRINHDPHDAP
jgi:hypothetical protein